MSLNEFILLSHPMFGLGLVDCIRFAIIKFKTLQFSRHPKQQTIFLSPSRSAPEISKTLKFIVHQIFFHSSACIGAQVHRWATTDIALQCGCLSLAQFFPYRSCSATPCYYIATIVLSIFFPRDLFLSQVSIPFRLIKCCLSQFVTIILSHACKSLSLMLSL